jgi:hypothetical protein
MYGAIYPFDTCKEMYDHEMRRHGMKVLVMTSLVLQVYVIRTTLLRLPNIMKSDSKHKAVLEFPCSNKTFPPSPSSTQQHHLEGTQS